MNTIIHNTAYVAGVVIEIAGIILMYKYALVPALKNYKRQAMIGNGVEPPQDTIDRLRYQRNTKIGLAIVLLGSILQCISTFI